MTRIGKALSSGAMLSSVMLLGCFSFLPVNFNAARSQTENNLQQLKNKTRIGIVPLTVDENNENHLILSKGIQDALIDSLSTIPDLIVIDRTRTSDIIKELAFQQSAYVDPDTVMEMGKLMGVQFIYTGSVQQSNNELRIFIQELNVKTGESKSIIKTTSDINKIFQVQDEIAEKILASRNIKIEKQNSEYRRQQIVNTSSTEAQQLVLEGKNAIDNKDFKLAVFKFTRAIEKDRDLAEAYCYRGLSYYKLKSINEAFNDLDYAINLKGNYALPYIYRGYFYTQQSDFKNALQDLTKAQKILPNDAMVAFYRGYSLYRQAQANNALNYFLTAQEINPNYPEIDFFIGLSYYEQQKFDLAEVYFKKSVTKEPNNALNMSFLGLIYTYKNEFEKAKPFFEKSIRLSPENPSIWLNNGKYHLIKKQYSSAIESLEKCLELDSKNISAYFKLAKAYENQAENNPDLLEKAWQTLDALLELDPENPAALTEMGAFLYRSSESGGGGDLGFDYFNDAIQIDPKYALAYYYRALAWSKFGYDDNYQKSISDINQAIKINPENRDFLRSRGIYYEKSGKCTAAKSDFLKACELGDKEVCSWKPKCS